MKKTLLNILSFTTAILGFASAPAISQTAQPVGMQYVGSQQYIGTQQQIIPQRQLSPTINSVYAVPMQRVNEIPLYGKNKSMYFYGQPKKEEGLFANGGLYLFGSFTTGKTTEGINSENFENDFAFPIGSTAHKDMGDASGISFGFGRAMSSNLNIELMYSKYTGMNYGKFVQSTITVDDYNEEVDPEEKNDMCYDEEGFYICSEKISDDYEVSGGDVTTDFFGIGFQYKLDGMFGGIFGGMLVPYIGAQVGFAMNDLADYTVYDLGYSDGDLLYEDGGTDPDSGEPMGDMLNSECENNFDPNNPCIQYDYSDGEITFLGKTNKTFGYGLEVGFTIALESNFEIDLFFKRNMYGKAQNSGNVLSSYYVEETYFYADENGDGASCPGGWDFVEETYCVGYSDGYIEESQSTGAVESGNVYMNQYGIKIKYMF